MHDVMFCVILLYFINVGLVYARMALLCVSFREDNAEAVATMALEVFKRGYVSLAREDH